MAWRTASYTNDPRRSGTRAIPGYTGHLHNAKDVFGVSAGKALQQDSEGVDHTTLKKPKRSAASSTLLSPLDCDGAIWDHHYETSNQAMTSVTAADFDAKNADHGKQVQPNIVGYTGHIHMSHDILGASHDSVVRVSQNARREQLRNIKPLTEESRPHWTAFRAGNKTNPAWKQEYAQILTTRSSHSWIATIQRADGNLCVRIARLRNWRTVVNCYIVSPMGNVPQTRTVTFLEPPLSTSR